MSSTENMPSEVTSGDGSPTVDNGDTQTEPMLTGALASADLMATITLIRNYGYTPIMEGCLSC